MRPAGRIPTYMPFIVSYDSASIFREQRVALMLHCYAVAGWAVEQGGLRLLLEAERIPLLHCQFPTYGPSDKPPAGRDYIKSAAIQAAQIQNSVIRPVFNRVPSHKPHHYHVILAAQDKRRPLGLQLWSLGLP